MGKSRVLWLILSFHVFFSFHLACISSLRWEWAETKRISIISVYPLTVPFNIIGMSAFVFFVLCYSKNARFAVSSQGWALGESGMSKGSPRQHPSLPQPWVEKPGQGSQQTTHSACTPTRQKTPQIITISHFSKIQMNLVQKTYHHVRDSQQFSAVAQ